MATKTSRSQRPKSGQRRAEKPEIQSRATVARRESPLLREIKRVRTPGMSLLDAKRIAEANLARAEQPVDDEIKRAAERAGIDTSKVEHTPAPDPRDVLRTALAPHLIRATDLVAETLAGAYADINPGDLSEQLADINRNLWAMRWELQLHSDEVCFGGAPCR
jgi:hypothetical protein